MSALSGVLGAVLRFIYETIQGMGPESTSISQYAISLIIMSIIMKLFTMPLMYKSTKNTQKGAELQPQVEAIQKKYAKDPSQMNAKIMQVYKDNNYSPTSGCLPMIISLVIIFAMFAVIREPAKYLFDDATKIHEIAKNFFWIPDLSKPDTLFYGLPLIYAVSMIVFSSMTQQPAGGNAQTKQMNMMMKYMMPIMMYFFSKSWESGLLLYWATSNIFEIIFKTLMKVFMRKGEQVQ
ncbi:MAG: YidC/Oxa1 family membrane protein insertase [Tissierellia bacterium]|nr:YidC/Oxa1 family membrane protein insertase [Tissierellia bacterium]